MKTITTLTQDEMKQIAYLLSDVAIAPKLRNSRTYSIHPDTRREAARLKRVVALVVSRNDRANNLSAS